MSDDVFKSPDWIDYAERFARDVLPKISDSALVASIVPEDPDPKACLEMGAALLLDKPIIAIVQHGRRVPVRLERAADEIVIVDLTTDAGQRAAHVALTAAMERVTKDQP